MDLDKTVPRKSCVDKEGKVTHYSSVVSMFDRNLKRKAHNDHASSVEQLPTEYQHMPSLAQMPFQESTTSQRTEPENSTVLLPETPEWASGLGWLPHPTNGP